MPRADGAGPRDGNAPGRSLYVRLRGADAGKGAAGKWTDAATGEHGDLLDLIAADRVRDAWPALIASVTDLDGKMTGAHRTWQDPSGITRAPVSTPRRAMGLLLGNGVRFGAASDIMAAGEGIETMLSLGCVTPTLPLVAALSANHLAALVLPATLRRLYLARDDDPAGRWAVETLATRAEQAGIEAVTLDAALGDFNEDLRKLGRDALAAGVRVQLAPEDVARF